MKQQVLEKTIGCCLINNNIVWSSNVSLGEAERQGDRSGYGRMKLWEILKAWGKLEVRWRCPKTGWIRRGMNELF